MAGVDDLVLEITPEMLLNAYASGIFPMAESADDPGLFWVEPRMRGILPMEEFHVSRRLARKVRQGVFDVRMDTTFHDVMALCAEANKSRPDTWINKRIRTLYGQLHDMGFCHSVECWQNGELVGGLYGLALRGAFFGESMFSRANDASKIALVHLVEHLKKQGFVLLDTQFTTNHLQQFGVIEVPRDEYRLMLDEALDVQAVF